MPINCTRWNPPSQAFQLADARILALETYHVASMENHVNYGILQFKVILRDIWAEIYQIEQLDTTYISFLIPSFKVVGVMHILTPYKKVVS